MSTVTSCCGLAEPNPWILGWVRSNPTMVGRVRSSKKKCMFKILWFPRVYCFTLFCLILVCFFCHLKKNTNPILKYPVFVKTSKNTKKQLKKEKNIFVHTTKCLKAKKSYCVFHTPKNNVLACILTLTKISKTIKKLFCLSFSIRGTTLHVIRIPDIKFFFFYARIVRFYLIKIRTSLQRRAFLKA
jgi:energy-converting hydrogenase Eha subunit F